MPQSYYVAVVGPGEEASRDAVADATTVGRLIAARGWVTLTGGRAAGVMAAAATGAATAGGAAVGILPGSDRADAAPDLTVVLPTGLGEARNAVLVTAADALIGCGINPGTASEIALALRAGKPVALVRPDAATAALFESMSTNRSFHAAATPQNAVDWIASALAGTMAVTDL